MDNKNYSRRDFLKKAGQISLVLGSGLSLETVFGGCTSIRLLTENQEEVDAMLESHPAIPTPPGQCYAGWHNDVPLFWAAFGQTSSEVEDTGFEDETKILEHYEKRFGQGPAVHSISDRNIGRHYFPAGVVRAAHSKGVIPMIRYYPVHNWQRISQGAIDDSLKEFCDSAVEENKPFIFTPFPEVGLTSGSHPWIKWDPKYFVPAWDRMYNIAEKTDVNKIMLWGLHLIGSFTKMRRPYKPFYVDPSQVNMVGVSLYDKPEVYGRRPFRTGLGSDYHDITAKYETKPFAIWELGTTVRDSSGKRNEVAMGKWILRTYETITKWPRIKLLVWYGINWRDHNTSFIIGEAQDYYRKAISNRHFIGSRKL